MPFTLIRLVETKFNFFAVSGVTADNIAPVSHNALIPITFWGCIELNTSASVISFIGDMDIHI